MSPEAPRNATGSWLDAHPVDPRPVTLALGVLWLMASFLFLLWSGWISGTTENHRAFSTRILVLTLLGPCCALGAGLLSRSRPRPAGIWLVCAAAASTVWFQFGMRAGPYVQARDEMGWVPVTFLLAPMLCLGLALMAMPPKSVLQKLLAFCGVAGSALLIIGTVVFIDGWRSFLRNFGIRI